MKRYGACLSHDCLFRGRLGKRIVGGCIVEPEAGQKKYSRKIGRQLAQERRGTRTPENRTRSAAPAERTRESTPFARLKKNRDDEGDANQNVDDQQNDFHSLLPEDI